MQVKSDQVFLVQYQDKNLKLQSIVVISNNVINAKDYFEKVYISHNFVGITSLTDYIRVQKNIAASLNGDKNAWPLIIDQTHIDQHGL